MTQTLVEHADDLIHRVMATPEGHEDPYPFYRRLRAAAPVHRSELDGNWYVSGFDACRQILGDPRIGKNDQFVVPRHGVDPERVRLAQRRRRTSMLTANPPEHTRLRGAAKGAFIPPAMSAIQPRVAAIIDERLDRLAALGEADVMAELAFPMPVTVVGEMVGVPEEDRAWFRPLMRTLVSSDSIKRSQEELDEVKRAGDELDAYFVDLIARRRKDPSDDLLSYFIAQADDGLLLDEDELFATVTLLFFAGFLTTTNLIGNGLAALFDHPGELARLWEHPELAASAVEEVVRFDSPVQFVHRNVLEDLEVEGQHLAAGDVVMVLLAAANRDPDRFADPDRFDVGRSDNLHLAFAWGLHFCLGARLARMEGQLVFRGLVERFARVEPAGEPVRNPGLAIRGFESLPVRFRPR